MSCLFTFVYNRNGSRFSVVLGVAGARRAAGVAGVPDSDASDGLRSRRDTAVCCPDRTGVVLPDGVLCLARGGTTISVGILEVRYIPPLEYLPLAGVR